MFNKRFAPVLAKTIGKMIVLMLGVLVCLSVTPTSAALEPDTAAYAKCGRACTDCSKACAVCFKHCEDMAKAGDKTHEASAKLSLDCISVCDITATIVKRKGPLSPVVCEACMKACEQCAAECGKSPQMAPMAACKKSCDSCATACKELMAGF